MIYRLFISAPYHHPLSSKIVHWAFIIIFRLDCGALFGNLFWPQFEYYKTNSFERKIRIETRNIQHVLVSIWTPQFFQNLKFSSSYFSPRQKTYKATRQLSCLGHSDSSKTKVNTTKRSALLL